MGHNLDKLGIIGTERVCEFLLHHMSMDVRRKLMKYMPVEYAILHPSVDADLLTAMVDDEIRERRAA